MESNNLPVIPEIDNVCNSGSHTYIIQSNKKCYHRIGDISTNRDVTTYDLSPACQNGDHYVACDSNTFYIIKGKEYRRCLLYTSPSPRDS